MPRSCLAKYQQSTEHFQSNYRASSKQSPSNYLAKAKQIPRKYQANSEGKTKEVGVEFDHFGIIFGDFWGPGSLPRASSKENGFHYDFWSLSRAPSGWSWGQCCDKVGLMKFVFLNFCTIRKASAFPKLFSEPLEPSLDRIGVHF